MEYAGAGLRRWETELKRRELEARDLRAAIYTRVSSDPKHQGRSVSEQESDCRSVAEHEGWTVERVFVDNDRSASRYSKKGRPAYLELVEFIKGANCDVVITWEASRFQRDLEAYVKLRELCRANSVFWSYTGRTYDLSRTDDRLMTGLDALLAERESDVTRDRILRATRSNATKGRPHGKLAFGFRREYDMTTGTLIRQLVREDHAELIREAAKRFLSGETPYIIAKDFNERGVAAPRGGEWTLTQIRRCLTNPAYNGKRVFQGRVIGEADWPAILDDVTFSQCVTRFSDPRRKTSRDSRVKYLLSGIATCGVCGSKLKYGKPRGAASYVCRKDFCVARNLAQTEELVTELILRRLEQPDAQVLFQRQDAGIDNLITELADKRSRLDGFYDSAASGEISPNALGRIEAQLLSEITELERKLRRADVPLSVVQMAEKPREVWKNLAITQRREVIRSLVRIRILPTQCGRKKVDPDSIEIRWIGEQSDPE